MTECQKKFEAWATDGGVWPKAAEKTDSGEYKYMQTAQSWTAWSFGWDAVIGNVQSLLAQECAIL